MTTSVCSEVEQPDNPNKPPIKCDTSLTHTASSKESCPTFSPPPECFKRSTTKNSWAQVTSSPDGILTKALKCTQWIWEERLLSETSQWEALAVGSFTDTVTHTTSPTWLLSRRRTFAYRQCRWPWKETGAREVLSGWRTLLRKEWRRSTTLMKVFLTSRFDDVLIWCSYFLRWVKRLG